MREDNNVLDFGTRAALERARRQGFLLSELDAATPKGLFDAVYIDCKIDSDD